MTINELHEKMAKVREICENYNYWDKVILPYGHKITIREFVKPWEEDKDSYGLYLRNGFVFREVRILLEIVEKWKEFDDEPKMKIKFIAGDNAGKTKEIQISLAEIFIKTNMAIAA